MPIGGYRILQETIMFHPVKLQTQAAWLLPHWKCTPQNSERFLSWSFEEVIETQGIMVNLSHNMATLPRNMVLKA